MALNWGPWVGAAQLALGRGRGIVRFGDTPQAFYASLAPWIAFPLVYALLALTSGEVIDSAVFMLAVLVGQLTPPVLSHALAVRWAREEEWVRYATAYNWCQWSVSFVFLGLLLLTTLVLGLGVSTTTGVAFMLIAVVGFYFWISWVVARHGLGISPLRAVLLVVVVNVVTFGLLTVPQLIQQGVTGFGAGLNGSAG